MRIQQSFSAAELRVMAPPIAVAGLLFGIDLVIPRGATPAIGYCTIPVLAAGTRRGGFLVGMTVACIILTWTGFLMEPSGAAAWMSAFDRAMITGTLWLIFKVVSWRSEALAALACQTHALEETKRELERSNSELESFASIVAHDIRGPLGSISLLAQAFAQPASSSEDAAECAMSIQREVTSLSNWMHKLLSYGRVGGGQVQLSSCDCEAVVSSVRKRLKSEIQASVAQVTNDPLPTLPADPMLIGELFQNLIENGIRYRSTQPPRIHLSAAQCPGGWRFSVQDNGRGIESADLERIFQPFRQASRGDSRGFGLGLATCKRIVERHGGHIKAECKPGCGSTFTFTLAVAADADVGPLAARNK